MPICFGKTIFPLMNYFRNDPFYPFIKKKKGESINLFCFLNDILVLNFCASYFLEF